MKKFFKNSAIKILAIAAIFFATARAQFSCFGNSDDEHFCFIDFETIYKSDFENLFAGNFAAAEKIVGIDVSNCEISGCDAEKNRSCNSAINLKKIPESIEKLKNLKYLEFFGNNFSLKKKQKFFFPQNLWKLQNLEILKLPNLQISGEIPAEIGQLKNLKILDLSANNLSGKIPTEIAELDLLELKLFSKRAEKFNNFECIPESVYNILSDKKSQLENPVFCEIEKIAVDENFSIPTAENQIFRGKKGKKNSQNFPQKKTRAAAEKFCKSLGKNWQLPTVAQFQKIFTEKENLNLKMAKKYFVREKTGDPNFPARFARVEFQNQKLALDSRAENKMKSTDFLENVICVLEK